MPKAMLLVESREVSDPEQAFLKQELMKIFWVLARDLGVDAVNQN